METVSKALLAIHIFSGFFGLILFWIPIFVKKGGKVHRQIGKLYVFLMWIVVVTSIYLSIENFIQGGHQIAAFLGFIALITANPLWYGIEILKHKRGIPLSYQNQHIAFNGLIVLAGLAMLSYGIYLQAKGFAVLMVIFGILGIATGSDIVKMKRNPEAFSNPIFEHLKGMMISGIAAHTAFAVFGGNNFFSQFLTGYWMVLPWTAPTVIGFIIIKMYKKQYLKTA